MRVWTLWIVPQNPVPAVTVIHRLDPVLNKIFHDGTRNLIIFAVEDIFSEIDVYVHKS